VAKIEDLLSQAIRSPRQALRELDRLDSEESLLGFVKAGWHVLHPGTPFISGWAVEAMCDHLQAVTRGEINRLLINVPPGFAKSMTVNVYWPAWEWGPQGLSHYQYISASYEKGLAIRDMVYCRDLVRSEWYQDLWPLKFKEDQDGKEYYQLEKRGWRFAASVGSGLTGRRGHRFIIDDPHSVQTAESEKERATTGFWFTEVTPTRFVDVKKPVYVIIMQRLHEQDVSGLILNKLIKDQEWTHLCIPMEYEPKFVSYTKVPSKSKPERVRRIKEEGEPLPFYVPDEQAPELYRHDPRTEDGELAWPERFDQQSVNDLKVQFRSTGGTYAEAAQLQQRPVPRGGGMFQKKDFVFIDRVPENVRWYWGWDLAATKDGNGAYTAGVKLGRSGDQIVIADVVRFRGSPHEVEQELLRCAQQRYPMSLPQDPGQAGKAQRSRLAAIMSGYDIHFSPETGSKQDRARPLAAQSESGNIALVRASWNDAFIAEATLFPNGQFLDQIDAASRGFAFMQERSKDIGIAIVPGKAYQ
jgi:predicted phage terminase large subunit-like protein